MRVVLYAEGPGELGRTSTPAAGEPLSPDALGPAHCLVRRAFEAVHVEFIAGLQPHARRPRGGALLHRPTLVRLLSWALPELMPDLAIVLVDNDGVGTRRSQLQRIVAERNQSPPVVVGVAHEEFESWLIADPNAAQRVLGITVDAPKAPDSLGAGQAKRTLTDWITKRGADSHGTRRAIAETMDLDVARSRSASLDVFLGDLRGVALAVSR